MPTRKKTYCLNCNRRLTLTDNFCPECGQENLSNRFSLRILIYDFFNNYFSFDSRLGRSIWPFLSKPGYLTSRFNEGKRVHYVHPLRLYIILSFLFFFVFALWSGSVSKFNIRNTPTVADSIKVDVSATRNVVPEVLQHDSVAVSDIERFFGLMENRELSDEQVMDSLGVTDNSSATYKGYLVKQARKVIYTGAENFVPYAVKNISILIFLLLPIFALLLWWAYKKAEPYYIGHLVHTLHIHSFIILVFLLTLLLSITTNVHIWGYSILLCLVYIYLSMKKVYEQSYFRTFWKFLGICILYLKVFTIGFMAEMFLSFLLY